MSETARQALAPSGADDEAEPRQPEPGRKPARSNSASASGRREADHLTSPGNQTGSNGRQPGVSGKDRQMKTTSKEIDLHRGFDSEYEIDGDALLAGSDSLTDFSESYGFDDTDRLVTGEQADEEVLRPLRERIQGLEEENKMLQKAVERLQSEYEKMRRRYEREREGVRQTIQGELMHEVLPLMDNFERAMAHATAGDISEDFVTGIVLLYKQLSDLLEQNQVIPIMATGESFNPEFHEAVVIEPASDYEANTVIAEFEKGYTIGTRLLRPARVKVAVRPK